MERAGHTLLAVSEGFPLSLRRRTAALHMARQQRCFPAPLVARYDMGLNPD